MALLILPFISSLQSPKYLFSSIPNLPHSLLLSLCNCKRLAKESVRKQEAMADQKTCVRADAKKLTIMSAGLMEEKVVNKKRIVLGEVSNLSNVSDPVNRAKGKETQKKQPKGKLR